MKNVNLELNRRDFIKSGLGAGLLIASEGYRMRGFCRSHTESHELYYRCL